MDQLSPGEKIKKLRLELGLKQEDITNEKVSKSLISMIEKNKRGLTWNTAAIIAECLNKYYGTMGKKITAEFLMETEIDRVRKEVKEEAKFIQSLIDTGDINAKLVTLSFEKVMDLVKKWDMKQEMMEIQLLRGRFYYNIYQYNKALEEASNVLEYFIEVRDYSQVAFTYNLMGACYYMNMMMEQALTYYTKAYDTVIEHNTSNKVRIKLEATFNLVICYRKIHRYDMALQYINMFKEVDWDDPIHQNYQSQLTLVEANTYRDLKNYEKAEKLYDKLFQKSEGLDINTQFLVYDNYTILYMEQGKIDKALSYVNKAFEMREGVRIDYIPWIFVTKAKCLMILNKPVEALETLKDGLVLAEGISENEMIIDFHFTLAQAYISFKDYDSALQHLQDAEKIIMDNNIKLKKNDLYSFYIEVYLGLDEREKSIEYATKMRRDYLAVQ